VANKFVWRLPLQQLARLHQCAPSWVASKSIWTFIVARRALYFRRMFCDGIHMLRRFWPALDRSREPCGLTILVSTISTAILLRRPLLDRIKQ
jgi:hypothetical protein